MASKKSFVTFKVAGPGAEVIEALAKFGLEVVEVRKVLKGRDFDRCPLHLFIGITSSSESVRLFAWILALRFFV